MHLEEDHLVWMLVDHPGTFLLQIQEEALGHLETPHRHNPDIDHKVERLEDSWMVEEFLMMLLVVLLVDILV